MEVGEPKNQVKAVLLLASTMTIMAGAVISPSIPGMEKIFSEVTDAYWIVPLLLTMPGLLIALTAPFAGFMMDVFGRKKPLMVGLFFYALSGSSGLYLTTLTTLLLGRALLGLAVGLVMTATTTLIADYFSGHQRDRFMGLQAAFMGLGGLVFLITGGMLADLNWRAPFAIYLISLFLIPCVGWWIDDPIEKGGSLKTNQVPNKTPLTQIFFIYAMGFLGMFFFYLLPVELPSLLVNKIHVSAAKVGIAVGFGAFFSAIGALLYPHIHYYLSDMVVYGLLFLLLGFGFLVLSIANSFSIVAVGTIFCGLGFGLLFPNSSVSLTNCIPARSRGRWIGGLSGSIFLGQFLVPIVYYPLVEACGLQGPCGAFNVTCFVSLGLAILLFSISWITGFFKPNTNF